MKLTIYFPDISGFFSESAHPALQQLLAVGQSAVHNEPLRVMLCRGFGVQAQMDWPLAALSWLGEGGDPVQDYWLQADPVHLALQRDYFTLADPVPLALSRQQATSLMDDLNRHFAEDGLQFHLGQMPSAQGEHWYLRLPAAPALSTCLPEQAAGRDIRPYMPQGADAASWRQIGNEIQMLLHEHPLNQAREAGGDVAVNSLWFSAGGVQPGKLETAHDCVYSDMPLLAGLARAAKLPNFALPDHAQALLDQAIVNPILAMTDLEQAEQNWFAPLLNALRTRNVQRMDLHFAVRDQVLSVRVHWYDLFKFWRRAKPVSAYFSS